MKYTPFTLVGIALLVFMFLCIAPGCAANRPVFQFRVGQKVQHVLDDRAGLVVQSFWYEYKRQTSISIYRNEIRLETGVPYYLVKFSSDNIVGIDTASGSGLLGNHRHNAPSGFAQEFCQEFELQVTE